MSTEWGGRLELRPGEHQHRGEDASLGGGWVRVPGGKCESESVDRNPGAPTLKGWTEEEKSFRERDMVAEMGAGEVGYGNREKRKLLRHSQDRSHLQPRYATPAASKSISCSSWRS